MKKFAVVLALVVAGLLTLVPALLAAEGGKPAAGEKKTISLVGSTTVGPIAKAFAAYYMEHHPDVNVTVTESGSGNGATALLNGTCDIATMSRFMKIEEFKAAADKGIMPVAHAIAMDGLSIIVHPANPVKGLTMAQVHDIYAGKVANWSELGGPNAPIVIISRDTSSGTYETFETKVMKGDKIAASAEYVGSNGQMRARVQSTENAVGYVGLGFVDQTVKDVPVNGIPATAATVVAGKYPISRPLFMFTNGYPELGSDVFALTTLYLSRDGQKMVEEQGFVPVTRY